MELLYLTCILMSVTIVIKADVSKIIDYFESDTFKTIQNHWQSERKSFENALSLILQQDYSYGGMNVYVRRMTDPELSDGFIFSDNIVNLVLQDTYLSMAPIMIAPQVTFALASNYLHLEAELGRMVLNSKYLLMRNQSDVVFEAAQQDTLKKSPFSFQQVQNSGELSIIAQACRLVGYTITSLGGSTVNLGLDTFKVANCKFSVEIYSSGLGSPPVFGQYFSEEQSLALEAMISKPIRTELLPKLQASVFSYINTSAIFGDKLPQLRSQQNSIFKKTSNYMSKVVRNFLENTIKETQGIIQLKPLEMLWKEACSEGTCENCVRLREVILYGLDTAYSAHIGGPFKAKSPKVAEAIRFSTMQVRGNIFFQNSTVNVTHDFAVELRDVAVNIEMKAEGNSLALDSTSIHITGWRTIEFSILEMYTFGNERQAAQSFITGYLVNEIPKRLSQHISKFMDNQIGKGGKLSENERYSDNTDQEFSKSQKYSAMYKSNAQGILSASDRGKEVLSDGQKESNSDLNKGILSAQDSAENGRESAAQEDSDPTLVENGKESAAQEESNPPDQNKERLSASDQSSVENGRESPAQEDSNPSLVENEKESAAQEESNPPDQNKERLSAYDQSSVENGKESAVLEDANSGQQLKRLASLKLDTENQRESDAQKSSYPSDNEI